MYLIRVREYALHGKIEVKYFESTENVLYVILSHTWGDEEIRFRDVQDQTIDKTKQGYLKIKYVCKQAIEDGIDFAWVDTCCIDKSSSAELSEAINSMYAWYKGAVQCYVYLEDMGESRLPYREIAGTRQRLVSSWEPIRTEMWFPMDWIRIQGTVKTEKDRWAHEFKACRWFSRGWTLQELIAPDQISFYGKEWNYLGDRNELLDLIHEKTGIDLVTLRKDCALAEVSVAKKLSWAADRETTRVEDRAYCLLGIFGINMALLYGEGTKAFTRLQEEIIKKSTDLSILTFSRWTMRSFDFSQKPWSQPALLAPSPLHFRHRNKVIECGGTTGFSVFEITNRGLKATLPLLETTPSEGNCGYLAILNCRMEDDFENILCIHLEVAADTIDDGETIVCVVVPCTDRCTSLVPDLHTINFADVGQATYQTVLIPSRKVKKPVTSYRFGPDSLWIRTLPASLKLAQVYPECEWNPHTRVMNRYRSLSTNGNAQVWGFVLRHNSGVLIAVCISKLPLSWITRTDIFDGSSKSLQDICTDYKADLGRRSEWTSFDPDSYFFLPDCGGGRPAFLYADAKAEEVLGEQIRAIDIKLEDRQRPLSDVQKRLREATIESDDSGDSDGDSL